MDIVQTAPVVIYRIHVSTELPAIRGINRMKKVRTGIIRMLDYQHFKHNPKLKHLIEETVEEYRALPLSDDAVHVYAAGDIEIAQNSEKEELTVPLSVKNTEV